MRIKDRERWEVDMFDRAGGWRTIMQEENEESARAYFEDRLKLARRGFRLVRVVETREEIENP